jgi:hypothetical protein
MTLKTIEHGLPCVLTASYKGFYPAFYCMHFYAHKICKAFRISLVLFLSIWEVCPTIGLKHWFLRDSSFEDVCSDSVQQ